MRLSESFEALRDHSDKWLAVHGKRPTIFLANIGAVAAFTTRNQFAKNLFEAGGILSIGDSPNDDQSALINAFKASSSTLACLCSSDTLYAEQAAATIEALKSAGAHKIYLAGRPGDLEKPLTQAGLAGFVYSGMDILEFLENLHDEIGLK
jgi:methylmalonyl-CoA mutase